MVWSRGETGRNFRCVVLWLLVAICVWGAGAANAEASVYSPYRGEVIEDDTPSCLAITIKDSNNEVAVFRADNNCGSEVVIELRECKPVECVYSRMKVPASEWRYLSYGGLGLPEDELQAGDTFEMSLNWEMPASQGDETTERGTIVIDVTYTGPAEGSGCAGCGASAPARDGPPVGGMAMLLVGAGWMRWR